MLVRSACTFLLIAVLLSGAPSPGLAATATTKKHPAASKAKPSLNAKPVAARRAAAAKGSTPKKRHATTASARPHTRAAHATVATHLPPPRPEGGREAVIAHITQALASTRVGIEGASNLRPFFDQLHQLELAPASGPVRIFQFGDSHTAADMFTGALRTLFQTRFGDAGAGFSYAGYPFAGYRIHGTKRAQSVGWTALGTHLRDIGDALVGMGGVSLSTDQSGSWVSLDAEATSLDVQYLIQPGGGQFEIYDGEQLLATVSTDGPQEAGHRQVTIASGEHHFEVRTTERAPVRLLGMVAEKVTGATYESIGLNGAEASLILRWNPDLQQTYLQQREPNLIVLAYGTNEASDHNWTEESYAAMFRSLIERFHTMSPGVPILVLGPADRDLRAGRRVWAPFSGTDRIVAAQRSVCRQMHCAYWDQRARMGGFGSMRQWVSVAWAQADHTHFTGEGYTELASSLFSDIVQQYNAYEGTSAAAGSIQQ